MRCALVLALVLTATPALAELKPGAKAPGFSVEAAQGGKTSTFTLAEALKNGPVVVYFYPKSFTSVCTVEAHEFAEAIPQFQANGASVIGISGDPIATQKDFSAKECRDKFPVGADPRFKVIRAYDAAMTIPGTDVGFAQRISYVIAPDGTVLNAYSDANAEKHIEYALATVRRWRAEHPAGR